MVLFCSLSVVDSNFNTFWLDIYSYFAKTAFLKIEKNGQNKIFLFISLLLSCFTVETQVNFHEKISLEIKIR